MRAPLTVRVLLLGAGLATAVPAWATPPELERARKQIDELQYDLARQSLNAALQGGQASVDELVELHRLTGEVAATLGDAVAAQAAFERALSIRPSTTLPEGVSPKIAEPFEAARRKLGDHRLTATATLDVKGGKLHVVIRDDPSALVGGARGYLIAADGSEQKIAAKGTGKLELDAPTTPGMHARVELIDAAGNLLAEIDADSSGGTPTGQSGFIAASEDDGGGARPIYTKWWLWASVGGVAAATGLAFGLAAKNVEDDLASLNAQVRDAPYSADYAEAKALEDKAKSRALGANILFGVAGACAIAAVVLAFTGDGGESTSAPKTTAGVAPTEGGATFAVGLTF